MSIGTIAEEDLMDLPWKFADPQEEARRAAEDFQRLSPTERWREIASMMAFGWSLVRSSPHRQSIEKQMDEHELEWQRVQRQLFTQHGR